MFVSLLSASTVTMSREVHDAHIHGIANLAIAFDRGALEVQFELPAMSLLGFEHTPKTQAHLNTINKTKALLNAATKVISIPDANCSPSKVDVKVVGPAGQDINGNQNHKEGHDHAHHSPDEEGLKNNSLSNNHSEVSAVYLFNCGDTEKIQFVNVALFEHFSNLEKIMVNWVTQAGQGQTVLRPKTSTVDLR